MVHTIGPKTGLDPRVCSCSVGVRLIRLRRISTDWRFQVWDCGESGILYRRQQTWSTFCERRAMWEKIRDERYCRERIGRVQIRRVASASLTTTSPSSRNGERRMGVCSKCRANKANTISESDMIQECSRLALLGPHPSCSQACSSDHR